MPALAHPDPANPNLWLRRNGFAFIFGSTPFVEKPDYFFSYSSPRYAAFAGMLFLRSFD